MRRKVKKISGYLSVLIAVFILQGFASSCKSHKKTLQPEGPYIEETVKVGKKKKKAGKSDSLRERIADESKTWLGTPYSFGCSEKGVATDCSGLVLVVFEKIAEIKLPRNSAQQADFCDDLKEKDVMTGDLVFFATGRDKKKVSHVGVMLDGNRFVHASASKGVIMSEMTTPYYRRTLIKFGRVPGLK